jgi:hypothetical protein
VNVDRWFGAPCRQSPRRRGARIDLASDGIEQLATGAELDALAGDEVLEGGRRSRRAWRRCAA